MTIGQRLRAAREANEMSIGDIARRTYIQPKFIQAIDEDNLSLIPGSHCRLFVREYAKLVGVNPEEVLAMLPEYEPPPPPPVEQLDAPSRRRRDPAPASPLPTMPESERKAYSDILRRLSAGGGIKLGGGSSTMVWLVGGAVGLLILAAVYYIFFSGKVPHGSAGDGAVVDSAASPTEILTRAGGDSAAPQAAAPVDPGDSLTLEGRASGKVWYAIVMDDGRRNESDTLDSGSVRTWHASKTFKVALANAGHLNLTLNGRSIGTLGPPNTSVRNQIIDASGIRKPFANRRPTAAAASSRRTPRTTSPARVITPTELRTSPPR